jgi:dihydrofolate reductase
MRKLVVFNSVTLDGYFTGANEDLSWAHQQDPEWSSFVEENSKGGGTLLFGRKTYEMMASFWPTPEAAKSFPVVAERMNALPKVVFSRTLDQASWNNTKLVKGDLASEVEKLKAEPGEGISILGSGSIVAQLAGTGLIDEYQFVVVPVVLGEGRTMFEGTKGKLDLKPTATRKFQNGNVLMSYQEQG